MIIKDGTSRDEKKNQMWGERERKRENGKNEKKGALRGRDM